MDTEVGPLEHFPAVTYWLFYESKTQSQSLFPRGSLRLSRCLSQVKRAKQALLAPVKVYSDAEAMQLNR